MLQGLFVILFALFAIPLFRASSVVQSVLLGVTVYLGLFCVVGSLLAVLGYFSIWMLNVVMTGLLVVAVFSCVYRADSDRSNFRTFLGDGEDVALVSGVFALPFFWSRIEFLATSGDAAVYVSYAKNLLAVGSGDLKEKIAWTSQFGGSMLEQFRHDNFVGASGYLPGTYCSEYSNCYYQFFPGWPALLALGAVVFGAENLTFIMLPVAFLAVYWFGMALAVDLRGARLLLSVLAFATATSVVYFAKYSTSEMFLLMLVLASAAILRGERGRNADSVGAIILFSSGVFVTHISAFMYFIPLLGLVGIYLNVRADRYARALVHSTSVVFLLSLVIGYYFSERYYMDIFELNVGEKLGTGAMEGVMLIGAMVLVLNGVPYLRTALEVTMRKVNSS